MDQQNNIEQIQLLKEDNNTLFIKNLKLSQKLQNLEAENQYRDTQYNKTIEDLEMQYNDRLAKYQIDAEEYYNKQHKNLEADLLDKIKELEGKLNQGNEKSAYIKRIDGLEMNHNSHINEYLKQSEEHYNNKIDELVKEHKENESSYKEIINELSRGKKVCLKNLNDYKQEIVPKYKEKIRSMEAQYNNVMHNHQQAEEMYDKKLKELTAEIKNYKSLHIYQNVAGLTNKETIKSLEESSKLKQESLDDLNRHIKQNIELEYQEKIRNSEERYNNKLVKALKEAKEYYMNEQKENETKYKEMIDELRQEVVNYSKDLNKYKQEVKNLEDLAKKKQNYVNILEDEQIENQLKYKEIINKLRQEKNYIQSNLNKYKEDINRFKKELPQMIEDNYQSSELLEYRNSTERKIKELKADNDNAIKNVENLKKQLETKNEELMDALKPRFKDEDLNDLVDFTTNIINLQNKLEQYITTLKGPIDINFELIKELYVKYNVKSQNLKDKILMKSVLQRFILEKVLEYADDYFKIKENDDLNVPYNQEKFIVNHANKFLELLANFYNNSDNNSNNNMVKTIPTKIRQYVYFVLNELGFPEIYQRKPQSNHPFISSTAQKLNQLMARYRFIREEHKRTYVENMAEDIIKVIVRTFKFCLLSQEPKCVIHWFKNDDKINPYLMNGQWDDDYLDDFVVDICYFPLIITMNSSDDFSESKVYSYAKVYPRNITIPQENKLDDLSLPVNKYKISPRNSGSGLINFLNRKKSRVFQNAASSSLSSVPLNSPDIIKKQDTALQMNLEYDNLQDADPDEDGENFNEDIKEKSLLQKFLKRQNR